MQWIDIWKNPPEANKVVLTRSETGHFRPLVFDGKVYLNPDGTLYSGEMVVQWTDFPHNEHLPERKLRD